MPNIYRYQRRGRWVWAIDVYVKTRTGARRVREKDIPTKEHAKARLAKVFSSAYEGRAFAMQGPVDITVAKAWDLYAKVSKRDLDSWRSDLSRSAHILRHLGRRAAAELGQADVDAYRALRDGEDTVRGAPPSSATLDREIELLRRVLGYAVRCGKLPANPMAGVRLLNKPNVRSSIVEDDGLEKLLKALGAKKRTAWACAPVLVSYDTGMRIGEVLHLRRAQLDKRAGCIRLTPQETKSEHGRAVYLQARTLDALEALPAVLRCPWLFANPKTRRPRTLPRRGFAAACKVAGLAGLHVHDLRRSYATIASRRHVRRETIMAQGGWRTDAVFRRYAIVDETDLAEAARQMEAAREESRRCESTSTRHADP